MGNAFTVETQALITTANALAIAAEEFADHARPKIEDAGISFASWPLIAVIYGSPKRYEQAREVTYKAVGNSQKHVHSIHTALHKVALHYMTAEKKSSLGDPAKAGLNPVAKQPPPVAADLPGGGFSGHAGGAARAVTAMALTAQLSVKLLLQATALSGMATFVAVVNGALIVTNVRDPFVFFAARRKWNDIREAITNGASAVINTKNSLGAWQGEASTAYQLYVMRTWESKMRNLSTLASTVGEVCTSYGFACISIAVGIIAATIPAIISAQVANAAAGPTAGFSMAAHGPIVAAWVGAIIAVLELTYEFLQNIDEANENLKREITTVSGDFFLNARKLEGDAMTADPKITEVNDSWTNTDFDKKWKLQA